mmetsp:Transcript_46745/g.85939  ORF Transcript_46745/g.85939 Transcript_46745/m.85939 type:complete len:90 (+) Transcript_46745:3-272(+)
MDMMEEQISIKSHEEHVEELIECFKPFDTTGSGLIQLERARHVMTTNSLGVCEYEVEELICEFAEQLDDAGLLPYEMLAKRVAEVVDYK